MTYRSDLAAAQARTRALEKQLAEVKAENAQLRHKREQPEPTRPAKPSKRASKPPSKPRGIRYEWPVAYFPLAKLWFSGMRTALEVLFNRSFRLSRTGNVLVWLLSQLVRPLVLCARGVAILGLLVVVAPYTALNMAIYSVLLLPIVLMTGLRFADAPRDLTGWIHGGVGSHKQAVEAYWFAALMPPVAVPAGVVIAVIVSYL